MTEKIDSWLQEYLDAVNESIATQSNEPILRFCLRESQKTWGDMLNSGCVISLP